MHARNEPTPLAGGTANRGHIVRVGGTVHRPRGVWTLSVHELLGHLASSGFGGVPRVLATTDNEEILEFVQGSAATDPLPDWALTDDALASVGALLRSYHDLAAGFDGSGGTWQRPVPERWRGPLVTHNDLHPANVVFRNGVAVAMIDFDLAAPGSRAWDLAVTACFWSPLRDAVDIVDRRRYVRRERFQLLLDSYGADGALCREVREATGAANKWIADIIEDNAKCGHPAFGRLWDRERAAHQRAAAWLKHGAEELQCAVTR